MHLHLPKQTSVSEENLPLDKKANLLNANLKKDINFISYQPPPRDEADDASWDEWHERLRFIKADLDTLLTLPHHLFWCQVIFDDSLLICVDSFLQHAPRPFNIIKIRSSLLDLHNHVSRLMFLTCVRMATFKESKEKIFTPDFFGNMLYENFIFDVPKIIDICTLYGGNNSQLLSKMIANIFQVQPKYMDDFKQVLPTLAQAIDPNLQLFGAQTSESNVPKRLSSQESSASLLLSKANLHDRVLYLIDLFQSITSLLSIYPPLSSSLHVDGFLQRLAKFYESFVSKAQESITQHDWSGMLDSKSLLLDYLDFCRKSAIELFHVCVKCLALTPIANSSSSEESSKYCETYLDIVSSVLGEKRFLSDLHFLYPINDELSTIQSSPYPYFIDDTRTDFLLEAVSEAVSQYHSKQDVKKDVKKDVNFGSTCSGTNKEETSKAGLYDASTSIQECGAVSSPTVEGVELESLISAVRDILPDLGEGFIEECLNYYAFNTESVINAALEDKFPESLSTLARNMSRKKKDINEPPPSLLDERRNVYDGDEFDVFRQTTVDKTKIHIGKREEDVQTVLDDKTELRGLDSLYTTYGRHLEVGESLYDDVYNDEYDDTYDSHPVSAGDDDSADELMNRKISSVNETEKSTFKQMPLNDKKARVYKDQQSSSSDEESTKRDQFVQDPALLRQRAEQRRASKMAGRGHRGHPPPARDVVGAAKGQGQEANVLRNRAMKERHRATQANHNRKTMSDRKHRV